MLNTYVWFRLWAFLALAWMAGALLLFWPEVKQSGPVHVHTGRVGDVNQLERYTAEAFGQKCLRVGRYVDSEKRIGLPENAEQESFDALGMDDPNFPEVESAPSGTKPQSVGSEVIQVQQPYIITRVFCPASGKLLQLFRWAMIPPLILLIVGVGVFWTVRSLKAGAREPH